MDNTIQSDLIRGHINTIILKALYDGDRYGFDIIKEIEQKSSGQYILKQPTLYSCLKRLEVQGFIKSYWGSKSNGGRRKYYTLTDMGKDLFIKNQTEWEYSRTVIDKLISDKDFDLSSVASDLNEEADEFDKSDSIESEFNEIERDESTLIETAVAHDSIADDNGIINGEQFAENSEKNSTLSELKSEDDNSIQVTQREYLDTTAIMNELFEQQIRNGASYTEKLKNEQYIPSETINPDNYFNNDYFQSETYDESPAYNTEDIINNFDSAKKEDDYVPPLYIPAVDDVYASANSFSASNKQDDNKPDDEETVGQVQSTEFYSYSSAAPEIDEKSLVINREYKNILSDLRNRNVVENKRQPQMQINDETIPPPAPPIVPPTEHSLQEKIIGAEQQLAEKMLLEDEDEATEDISALSNDKLQTRNFKKLTSDVKDLGDGIKIRTHNSNAAKEYASTYYYYSNKLMLTHYLILFVMMLLEITIAFLAIKIGCPIAQKNDLLFYILAVVVSLAFPIVAFIMNLRNPEKRKRVSFNFKMSLIFRATVMLEAFILIYAVNLIMGMSLTFDLAYLTTLLIPALMATNIPISSMVFQSLYKSNKFCVEN